MCAVYVLKIMTCLHRKKQKKQQKKTDHESILYSIVYCLDSNLIALYKIVM